VQLSSPELKPGEILTAKISVKNTGMRAGTEVLQLYIRSLASTAGPRPVRELEGFQEILLQPGESRDVSFVLTDRELGCCDVRGNWLLEPGKFQLWISKDSASGSAAEFRLSVLRSSEGESRVVGPFRNFRDAVPVKVSGSDKSARSDW
jgi:beta-glucosidase